MLPPPLPNQVRLLQTILERASSAGARVPLVVFDLDATLYDNRPRTLQILMEYGRDVEAELPDVAAAIRTLDIESVDYLLTDTLRRCALTQADVLRDVTAYWRDRFFTDDYIRFDHPIEGAADYVRACHDAGATVVYLTGRDAPGMLPGTVASLRDHAFPIGVSGVELVLKPDATMPDEAFKRGALPTLRRIGDVIAFFDNEPANCNVARAQHPAATIVCLDTQRVPGAPDPDPGVEITRDFRLL